MDDIRRPYQGQRGDYALPNHRPHQPPATDLRPQPAPQTEPPAHPHHQAHSPQHHHQHQASMAEPAYYQPPVTHEPVHHHQPQSHAAPVHHPAKRRLRAIGLPVLAVIIFAAAAAAGGYLLLKPHKAATFTPATLAQKASFTFYYPQPLPDGYTYVNTINTIDNGQAYFMLANGKKHIIIHEQAAASQNLDLSNLQTPVTFTAGGGKAATGTTSGQPAGVLLTSSTLINLNSTGQVTQADITAIIDALRPMSR